MQPTDKSLIAYYKEIDLSGKEVVRYYRFPKDEIVQITSPVTLIVSDNGHRIVDAEGDSHYVPYGWIHMWWENTPGREEGGFLCMAKTKEQARAVPENPGLRRQAYFDGVLEDSRSRGKDVFFAWEDAEGNARSVALTARDRVLAWQAEPNEAELTPESLAAEFTTLWRKTEDAGFAVRVNLSGEYGGTESVKLCNLDTIKVEPHSVTDDQEPAGRELETGSAMAMRMQEEFATLLRRAEANRCRVKLHQSHGRPEIVPIEKTDRIEVVMQP